VTDLFRGKAFKYVPSKKLVFLSFVLVFLSIFFAFLLFDFFSLMTYFLTVLVVTICMLEIKVWIYTRSDLSSDVEKSVPFWPLILLVAIGLFAPFLLLFILGPLYILILIDGYVAGVNLPEIIFFFIRFKSKDKS